MRGAHAYFAGSGGIRLHYKCWDVASPRGIVIIAHGLGEHSGRYEELAQDLARAGLSTFAHDHRGHGRSEGRRGHVRRFADYVQDLEKFRRRAFGSVGSDLPVFFLGHSLGGLILIRYLQEYPAIPVAGAVLSAPLLGLAVDVPRWKARLARLLSYAIPALPMSTRLPPEYLSHDREVVEAYKRDPLVHDRITPRAYVEIQRGIEVAFEKASRIAPPVLLLVPSNDKLVRPDLMQHFASAVRRRRRVTVETYPGFYHEVLNEKARSRVVADVLGWVERRLVRRPQTAAQAEPEASRG